MEIVAREQTALRLPKEVMIRAKYKAKQESMSLNAFLEKIITEAVRPVIPKISKDYQITPGARAFSGIIPMPTREQLEADDRLAYIIGKGD